MKHTDMRDRESEHRKNWKARAALTFTAIGGVVALFAVLIVPSESFAHKLPAVQANDIFVGLSDHQVSTFTVEVALGLPYSQNNVDPGETIRNKDALPAGDTFVQDGVVYSEGVVPDGTSDFNPSKTPGIGRYKVRGTWTSDLANFERAAAHKAGADAEFAIASEILTVGDGAAIMMDGMYPNAYFSSNRVVLGGTGRFSGVVGEVEEENTGENVYGFCNFRLKFKIRGAGSR